jgi:hypothetical protein
MTLFLWKLLTVLQWGINFLVWKELLRDGPGADSKI